MSNAWIITHATWILQMHGLASVFVHTPHPSPPPQGGREPRPPGLRETPGHIFRRGLNDYRGTPIESTLTLPARR
jgi:hypothetical protein